MSILDVTLLNEWRQSFEEKATFLKLEEEKKSFNQFIRQKFQVLKRRKLLLLFGDQFTMREKNETDGGPIQHALQALLSRRLLKTQLVLQNVPSPDTTNYKQLFSSV
jgi:hypothetical protein